MFVVFIIVLLFILLGILTSIYSVFSPFMQNIGNVVHFNSAYYWALGGIERAELVLKYKSPGFEWSWWFEKWTQFGPNSDIISWSFGLLTSSNNWFTWNITSRTNTIPSIGNGNIDYLLASDDSKNYNQLPYFTSEKFLLRIDSTTNTNKYYTGESDFTDFTAENFSWILRLPPKIVSVFSNSLLCKDSSNPACDPDEDDLSDDIVVNWIIDWFLDGVPFTILPTISVFYYSGMQVDTTKDITIRESIINQTWILNFGWTTDREKFSPIDNYFPNNTLAEHTVISTNAEWIQTSWFNTLLSSSHITWLQLSLGLINLLSSTNGNIYPFLEYRLSFPTPIADRFYTLEGNWLVWDYNVKIFIKKSTNESSSIGDFTVIF